MIKKIHDKANYLLIIILSIVLKTYYQNEFFYNGIKYLTSTRTMDLMFSILFTFLTFKIYIDKYYYIVLNRYNIITRLKKKEYYKLIINILLKNTIALFIINIIVDFLLVKNVNIFLVILSTTFSCFAIIILPKRKEYSNEMIILLFISIVLKLLLSNILV